MSSNMNLTLDMGIRVGPIMLSTLAKHYLAARQADDSKAKDEFLYHQAFNVVKVRLPPLIASCGLLRSL